VKEFIPNWRIRAEALEESTTSALGKRLRRQQNE
jgi:hypothetical protein